MAGPVFATLLQIREKPFNTEEKRIGGSGKVRQDQRQGSGYGFQPVARGFAKDKPILLEIHQGCHPDCSAARILVPPDIHCAEWRDPEEAPLTRLTQGILSIGLSRSPSFSDIPSLVRTQFIEKRIGTHVDSNVRLDFGLWPLSAWGETPCCSIVKDTRSGSLHSAPAFLDRTKFPRRYGRDDRHKGSRKLDKVSHYLCRLKPD